MRPCTIASRELAGSIGYATQWAKIWKKGLLYHIAYQKLEGQ